MSLIYRDHEKPAPRWKMWLISLFVWGFMALGFIGFGVFIDRLTK